ncbi:MAG TPA: hypothetical protein VFQ61_16385, partial [Polyangiaceae bacterium]|nr:hypothetical protein [Polyangiaceae bacterium]
GALEGYLDKMISVSEWARECDVPFGANIIVGHPGETEQSLRTSAAYMRRVFTEPAAGTHGFLSVDPFRLYPGSPIDRERERWESETGMVVHRYPWWHDGDQAFLSEWVDPSAELDYRRTRSLQDQLFTPILSEIRARFGYSGPARDYFLRAIDQQIADAQPRARLGTLGLHRLWQALTSDSSAKNARALLAEDSELRSVARAARSELARGLTSRDDLRRALEVVPRERFVPLDRVGESADDVALPLTEDGRSSISALHAYVNAIEWLSIQAGQRVVEFGAGAGYGAALIAEIVGPTGCVLAIESQAELLPLLTENLAAYPRVFVEHGFGRAELVPGAQRVLVSFALSSVPIEWLRALDEGAMLLAPVGAGTQRMLRYTKTAGKIECAFMGEVVYVENRDVSPLASVATARGEERVDGRSIEV